MLKKSLLLNFQGDNLRTLKLIEFLDRRILSIEKELKSKRDDYLKEISLKKNKNLLKLISLKVQIESMMSRVLNLSDHKLKLMDKLNDSNSVTIKEMEDVICKYNSDEESTKLSKTEKQKESKSSLNSSLDKPKKKPISRHGIRSPFSLN